MIDDNETSGPDNIEARMVKHLGNCARRSYDMQPDYSTIAIMAQARYMFMHSNGEHDYTMERAAKDAELDYVRITKILEDNKNEEKQYQEFLNNKLDNQK
jgi:hypothetical protein